MLNLHFKHNLKEASRQTLIFDPQTVLERTFRPEGSGFFLLRRTPQAVGTP